MYGSANDLVNLLQQLFDGTGGGGAGYVHISFFLSIIVLVDVDESKITDDA